MSRGGGGGGRGQRQGQGGRGQAGRNWQRASRRRRQGDGGIAADNSGGVSRLGEGGGGKSRQARAEGELDQGRRGWRQVAEEGFCGAQRALEVGQGRRRQWRRPVEAGAEGGGYAASRSRGGTLATVARSYPCVGGGAQGRGGGAQGGSGRVGFYINSTLATVFWNNRVILDCLQTSFGSDRQVRQCLSRTNFV